MTQKEMILKMAKTLGVTKENYFTEIPKYNLPFIITKMMVMYLRAE